MIANFRLIRSENTYLVAEEDASSAIFGMGMDERVAREVDTSRRHFQCNGIQVKLRLMLVHDENGTRLAEVTRDCELRHVLHLVRGLPGLLRPIPDE